MADELSLHRPTSSISERVLPQTDEEHLGQGRPSDLDPADGDDGRGGVPWNVLYLRTWSPVSWLALVARFILRDFFLSGLIISTLLWAISNHFFTHSSHTHATDQGVEWQYAFDIHTNSFFPLFLNLYVLQLILAPLVLRHNWVSLWIGNSVYLVAVTQYSYVTYLGYNSLPFLIKSEILLIPILLYTVLYFISLLGFNLASQVLTYYFEPFLIPSSLP